MARPREFDETEALEAAMCCFWTQGYESTSVRDLAAHMRITCASLYNAFGDKRALFRRALDHYVQSMHDRIGLMEANQPPLTAIRAFFDDIVERSVKDSEHRGCMLVNSVLEAKADDADLRLALLEQLAFIRAFFKRCIAAGQADGTVTSSQSADAMAQMLLSVLLGIRVLARTNPGRPVLEQPSHAVLAMLAAPA
jgi:TetR/AcrR family transcriptional regulator, transcriptional repressor for nem operon